MVSVFAWVGLFTIAFDDVLAEFTTLKGVFKKENCLFFCPVENVALSYLLIPLFFGPAFSLDPAYTPYPVFPAALRKLPHSRSSSLINKFDPVIAHESIHPFQDCPDPI